MTPDIVVQIKGGATKVVNAPSGGATRLVELSDVDATPLANGDVLTYVSANGKFEFHPTSDSSNAFGVVNVAGQNNVIANTSSDTIEFIAGTGILILTDNVNSSVTIVATGGSATDQFARDQANGAFAQANAAYANANTAIYTAAQIRANISNTAPINYSPSTGIISHADSGVTATTYGNTTFVPTITVDVKGHVTSITNTAIALPPSTDEFARAHANGAFDKANTANVTGQAAFDKANGAIYTAAQIRANISNTRPILYDPTTGVISFVPATANGQLLIGNTVSGSFDVNVLTQGAGILITNDKGAVTITANVTSATDQFARDQANAAFNRANTANVTGQAAFDKANGAIYTAAQIRANISNTAPINYDPSTGVISHALSGVTASGYGDAATVAKVVVDSNGHVTSVVNTAIAISATQITSGTLAVARGGTAQTAINGNGSLLIGNTVSGGYDVNTLTQGTNITITNDKGAITIASSDAFAQTQANAAFARANAAYANANTAIYTAAQIRANISNTAPIRYDATTGIVSHADSGVVASGYGDAATIPVFVANATGHISSVVNTSIAISATQITSGTLAVARGGTAQTAINGNGSLLIGNTVSGAYDVNTLTQGTGILITNDKGSITIAATGGASANGFGVVNVAGQSDLVAEQANDTLTIIAGTGIIITTDAAGDNLTITATGGSATDQYARDKANGAAQNAFVTLNVAGQSDIVADSNTDTLTIVGSGITILTNAGTDTLTIQHPASGVTPSGYGDAATVPKFVVDANGHVTSVVNTAIAISATQITSGTLAVARGGTGQTEVSIVNGAILIGNTVSGGYDVNRITQGAGVLITNDKGSITIKANGAGNVYGSEWIGRTSSVDNAWQAIAWNGTVFAAVASSGTGNRVMTSPDGITWTTRTSAADNDWTAIAWNGTVFAAVSSTGTGNRVMTSPDGITWTSRTSAADNDWQDIAWNGTVFAAVSSTGTGNRVMTSPDGTTWTSRTSAADNTWNGIAWNGTVFAAVSSTGTGNRVMTSPDGTTWTIRTSAADNTWNSVAWNGTVFAAVSSTGAGNRVMTSPDGTTWTSRTSAVNNSWASIAWSGYTFVAVSTNGTGNRVMTSPDGIKWLSRNSATDNTWNGVAWNGTVFAAVASSGTGNRVMTTY